MHYVTRRSHWVQKHMFSITCPDALFVESVPVPPEHVKYYVDVSRPILTGIHYVTSRSYRMQKHTFGVTCPATLFVESILVPLALEH
jgi:hypothetical protein